MPKEGFEPSRAYAHYALNVARLPVPPLRHSQDVLRSYGVYFIWFWDFVNLFKRFGRKVIRKRIMQAVQEKVLVFLHR